MRAKKIILLSLAILITTQIEHSVLAQNAGGSSKGIVGVKNKDVQIIISQIFSCPAWDEIKRGGVNSMQGEIMKSLASISENDVTLIREAIALLFSKYPQDTSLWSRVFLLNRYIFQVPEQSPVDENLFGGWAGVPIENGLVNRLWPFSYDSQNKLQLVGEFEGFFGPHYRGLDEFDYFLRKFGLRKK